MTAEQHYNKGKEYLKERKVNEALDSFNKALEMEPDNPYALSDRGVTYFHMKKFELAIIDMDKAVKIQPDDPYRYSSRAYIRAAMGDLMGGIEDYKRAIKLDPQDAIAYNNLGLLEEKMGYDKPSKMNFDKADSIARKDPFYAELYGREDSQNRPDSSAKLSTERSEVGPSEKVASQKEEKQGFWSVVYKVFSSKKTFNEFLQFVKNGFKLK
mgnify:CR=1 FL=1